MKFRLRSLIQCACMVAFLTFSGTNSNAQIPTWHWATRIESLNNLQNGKTENIGSDSYGNVYMVNMYPPNAIIGDRSMNNANEAIFLTKMNTNGFIIEATELKGVQSLGKMVVDNEGNTVIAAGYTGSVLVDTFRLNSTGSGVFIAKYASNGRLLWVTNFPCDGELYIYKGLAVDVTGNVYVNATARNGAPVIGRDTLHFSRAVSIGVTIKLDGSGNIVWYRPIYTGTSQRPGLPAFEAYSVAADKGGNVYFGGYRLDSVFFDSLRTSPIPNTSFGDPSMFVGKYDKNGQFLWIKKVPFKPNFSMTTNSQMDLMLYGIFESDSFKYDQLAIQSTGKLLIKCDSDGVGKWCRSIATDDPWSEARQAISTDSSGNIYTLGQRTDNLNADTIDLGNFRLPVKKNRQYLLKYDGQGTIKWGYGFNYETIYEACANSKGDFFVNGKATRSPAKLDTLGDIVINPDGRQAFFVAKYAEQRPSGITAIRQVQGVEVFPNPTTGLLTVRLKGLPYHQLSVIDQLGSAVYQQSITMSTSDVRLNLSNLPNGIYYIQLRGNGSTQTQKLVLDK